MAKRIKSKYDTRDNPNLGGQPKPTSPDIKRTKTTDPAGPDDQKMPLHARRVWNKVRPHKPAKSKGSTDVPAKPVSKRIGRGKGYDGSRGYTKVG